MNYPMLKIEDISKHYTKNNNTRTVLHDITYTFMPGSIYGIIGRSGSGKSTLAKIIAGYDFDFIGAILLDNQSLYSMTPLQRSSIIQLVFQNPYRSFNPRKTLLYSVMEPHYIQRLKKSSYTESLQEMICDFALPIQCLNKFPGELSGGQLQKLSIIRALLIKPTFLVTDECLASLDIQIQYEIIKFFKKWVNERKMGLVFISHDIATIANVCHKIIVLQNGTVVDRCDSKDEFIKSANNETQLLRNTILI